MQDRITRKQTHILRQRSNVRCTETVLIFVDGQSLRMMIPLKCIISIRCIDLPISAYICLSDCCFVLRFRTPRALRVMSVVLTCVLLPHHPFFIKWIRHIHTTHTHDTYTTNCYADSAGSVAMHDAICSNVVGSWRTLRISIIGT
jgi:hypothetical protein